MSDKYAPLEQNGRESDEGELFLLVFKVHNCFGFVFASNSSARESKSIMSEHENAESQLLSDNWRKKTGLLSWQEIMVRIFSFAFSNIQIT